MHLLIAAAGSGRRMGATRNKLLLPLSGQPVLAWTLQAMVLAIRDGSALKGNPSGEERLGPGQLLVVMGSQKQLELFRNLLGDAIDTIETMRGT